VCIIAVSKSHEFLLKVRRLYFFDDDAYAFTSTRRNFFHDDARDSTSTTCWRFFPWRRTLSLQHSQFKQTWTSNSFPFQVFIEHMQNFWTWPFTSWPNHTVATGLLLFLTVTLMTDMTMMLVTINQLAFTIPFQNVTKIRQQNARKNTVIQYTTAETWGVSTGNLLYLYRTHTHIHTHTHTHTTINSDTSSPQRPQQWRVQCSAYQSMSLVAKLKTHVTSFCHCVRFEQGNNYIQQAILRHDMSVTDIRHR